MAGIPQLLSPLPSHTEIASERGAQTGIASGQAQQSWMNSAQERQLRARQTEQTAQETAQAQQKFLTLLPALVAKASADKAQSENQVAALTAEQLARGQYSSLIASAPDDIFDAHNWEAHPEWLSADGTPDWQKHTEAMEKLQAKYAPLALIPEGKGYLTEINNATARGYQMQMTHNAQQSMVDRARMQVDMRTQIAQETNDVKLQLKDMDAQRQKEINDLKAQLGELASKTKVKVAETAAGATLARPANQAAVKANEAFLQGGQAATQELIGLNRGLELLDDPTLRTGTGAEFMLSAKRLGGALGLDTGDAKNVEQLQSVLGTQLLDRAKAIKGRLTNTEIGMLNKMSPDLAKTPEGNRALLGMLKAQRERELNVAKIVNEGRADGLSEREIQLEANQFLLGQGASAPSSAPAAPTWTPDKEARLKELQEKRGQPAVP